MSEQEENTGTEEQVPVIDELTPDQLGDVPNEGTDTEALDTTLLGKIVNEVAATFEVIDAVATEGADWVKKPEGSIGQDSGIEFDVALTITAGDELTGTIHMSNGINLYFDVNGEENHVSSSNTDLGVIVDAEISPGPHAVATWTLKAGPTE